MSMTDTYICIKIIVVTFNTLEKSRVKEIKRGQSRDKSGFSRLYECLKGLDIKVLFYIGI